MKTKFKKMVLLLIEPTKLYFSVIVLLALLGCSQKESLLKHYTVNFAGESVSISPQLIVSGDYAKAPEHPNREGYSFRGWFTDDGIFMNEWNFATNTVTENVTLYAKWEKFSLQGTKWKLLGIGGLDKIAIQELEPKDCNECYTLVFGADKNFQIFSSTNQLHGVYDVDYITRNVRIIDFGGTKINEIGDGDLYVNPFWKKTIQSFSVAEQELRFYYGEYKDYLLFKPLKL